jgi:hypothetical protein
MIDNPLPDDWKELQRGVCRLFTETGLTAEVEVSLKTPRGTVTVDVFAVDQNSVDKIQYIVECKNWGDAIPQTVVHSFTTVMHETGANLGFIVSKYGLQSGATQYTEHTNIRGLTYEDLQRRYFNVWWQRFFCPRVSDAAEYVNQYVEPFNAWRDRFLEDLPEERVVLFRELQQRYAAFGMLMWLMDVGSIVPKYAHDAPPSIDHYRSKLAEALGEEFRFEASLFRELLAEVCAKLKEIESAFNAVFGRNIFDHTNQEAGR